LLAAAGGAFASGLPPRVEALAREVRPARITAIDLFDVEVPVEKGDAGSGKLYRYTVARVDTDAGVRGYSFAGPSKRLLDTRIRPALLGKDLFDFRHHWAAGILEWDGFEHALWDAIGKLAGQPVYRLFGGSKKSVKLYLTTVWRGNPDQSHVSYEQQAEMAVKFRKAGFKGMKIRAWRPNPIDDTEACRVIRAAVGPGFAIMFDRTAANPRSVGQKVWDYQTGLRVARALEKNGAYWLEEPFDRDDFFSPARLAREVDLLITGGEEYLGLDPFRECLMHRSYDVLNPESRRSGGILLCTRVAAMAQAFHIPCIFHGTMGLRLAGCLQATAAIGAEWQELVFITPPLLPEDLWAPGIQLLNTRHMYVVRDGEIEVPDLPGLGLDINEDALAKYRLA
jgi:L-alanine-DL-glutamate epimerase-like enolase superfamily enzyme